MTIRGPRSESASTAPTGRKGSSRPRPARSSSSAAGSTRSTSTSCRASWATAPACTTSRASPRASCRTWVGDDPNAATNLRFRTTTRTDPHQRSTHHVTHPRPSIEMEGGTTFNFIDASPAEALEAAREAAGGQDVRIGGGPTVVRDFLAAGLVDHMHTVVVPILLGRGVRLWDGLEGLEKDYNVEAASSPSGVTHVTFTRAGV